MSKDKQLKKFDSGQIEEEVTSIETEEIDYDLDSDPELEKDYNLLKYEFNMIELPFFTKDKKIENGKGRRYTFSKKDNSYMRIIPSGDKELLSNKIPQEFDEKIFYGILKLSREQGSTDEIVTDYFTLAKASGVHYNNLERIKDALQRLSRSTIELNNLMYSAKLRTKVSGNKPFPILEHVHTYTFEETVKLSEDIRGKYRKYFRNRRLSEILIIKCGSYLFQNIESKGFLYFDQKKLLSISNATARKIYLMVTKWKGYENKNTIKRSCRFIASRVPLSWETKNIGNTVRIIVKSCQTLKTSGLLKDFLFYKTKPVGNSYVEFVFDEDHNKIDSYNVKAAKTNTGLENIIIDNVEDEYLDDRQTTLFDDQGELDLKKKEQELKEKAAQVLESLDEKEKALLINRARNSMQYDHYKYKIEQKTITEEELLNEVILLIIEKDIEDGIIQ